MGDPTDFTACPHWGKGGRYTVDPATGARVPVLPPAASVERVAEADGVQKTAVEGDTLTAPVTTPKRGK